MLFFEVFSVMTVLILVPIAGVCGEEKWAVCDADAKTISLPTVEAQILTQLECACTANNAAMYKAGIEIIVDRIKDKM